MYEFSEEMKQVLSSYTRLENKEDEGSKKSDFQQEDGKNHSDESTRASLEDEHSLLSESALFQYNTEHAHLSLIHI